MYLITLQQITKMFSYNLLGFILRRCNVLSREAGKVLSNLELTLLLPCVSLSAFASNFTVEKLAENRLLVLFSVISFLLIFGGGTFIGRHLSQDHYTQNLCVFSINVTNISYTGVPLVLALYGEEMVMKLLVFAIPISIYGSTIGNGLLLDLKGASAKNLLQPYFLSILAGIILGLTQIPIPGLIMEVLDGCSACMMPIAMLLTGCIMADFDLFHILDDWRVFAVSLIRMIAVPLLVLLIGSLIHLPKELMIILAAVYAMPVGANAVIVPTSAGKDCSLATGVTFITNLIGLLTIPIFFMLFA